MIFYLAVRPSDFRKRLKQLLGDPFTKRVQLISYNHFFNSQKLWAGSYIFACQQLLDPKADSLMSFNEMDLRYYIEQPKKTQRGEKRSARLKNANTSVPVINPSCTDEVR